MPRTHDGTTLAGLALVTPECQLVQSICPDSGSVKPASAWLPRPCLSRLLLCGFGAFGERLGQAAINVTLDTSSHAVSALAKETEAKLLSRVSRRYQSHCRGGTGAASQKCHAPTGATVSSMCRDHTRDDTGRRVHSVNMGPATAPSRARSHLPRNAESPAQSGLCSNEPCWTRTSDHRIKSPVLYQLGPWHPTPAAYSAALLTRLATSRVG